MMRTLCLISGLLACSACSEGGDAYRDLTGDLTCPNVSPVAQPYIIGTEEYPVRCGPQTQRPY